MVLIFGVPIGTMRVPCLPSTLYRLQLMHRLGRAVEVVQQRVEGGVELVGHLAGQRLAADRHALQGAPLVDPGQRQEQPEQRRHEVHRR